MATYYAGFIPCDGVIAVLFPDVPGCSTQGDTLEEAFSMAMDALDGHLVAMAGDGDQVPRPSAQEAAWSGLVRRYEELMGAPLPEGTQMHPVPGPDLDTAQTTISLSMRKFQKDMLDRKAEAAGMSRSGLVVRAVEAFRINE